MAESDELSPAPVDSPVDAAGTAAEPLNQDGLAALEQERQARKAAERRLRSIEKQLQGLDPEQLRSIKEVHEREEQLRAEMEQRIKEAADAARHEALAQVKAKDQKLSEVLAEKTELFRRQALANAFQVAGGRSGGADDGTTYFDALLGAVGSRFKVNDAGDVVVINPNGEPLLSDSGDPISPAAYLEQLKTHPVYGHFFAPTSSGHGGGMRGSGNVTAGSLQGMSALEKISYGLGA